MAEYSVVLNKEPGNSFAAWQVCEALGSLGRFQEARACAENLLRVRPEAAEGYFELGKLLAAEQRNTEAIAQFRRAIALQPDFAPPYPSLAATLSRGGQFRECIDVCRAGLRVEPFNIELHYSYATAAAQLGDLEDTLAQMKLAAALAPNRSDILNNVAWLLATCPDARYRNGPEAVTLAENACALSHRSEPLLLGTLAAAYAEAGRFEDAVKSAEEARDLAVSLGQTEVAERNAKLLELYRARKPFRAE